MPATAVGPGAANWYLTDPLLRARLGAQAVPYEDLLEHWGALAAGALDELAVVADAHPPVLVTHDRNGNRIDRVDYHPSYQRMVELAYGNGLIAHPYGNGGRGRVPRPVSFAFEYLFGQAEGGLLCPVAMTDGVAQVLRAFSPELWARFGPRLTATDPGQLAQGAMFMTEKQGGSDVGATETVACRDGESWLLTGEKWFCSNASAELTLTLARPEGAPAGTRGLGQFLLPRVRSDGTPNAMTLHRLKDKLGTRSMATGEVGLHGAEAHVVGDVTRGFVQMTEMINLCRLSNAVGSLAIARRALTEAMAHAQVRTAFGRPIIAHPLVASTLASVGTELAAHLAALWEAIACFERLETGKGSTEDRALFRLLVPVLKFTTARYSVRAAAEGIEILGGNGCIEEFVTARLYRDAEILVVWEGTTNVLILDALRAMAKDRGHQVLFARIQELLAQARNRELAFRLQGASDALREELEILLPADPWTRDPGLARWLPRALSLFEAALLLVEAGTNSASGVLASRIAHDLLGEPFAGSSISDVISALGAG